jgi:hypothetical protein
MVIEEDAMSSHPEILTQSDEEALVRQLAQQVLETTAPEELAIFDETAEEYFADPEGVLEAKGRDEAVGFGLELALLTPYILAVARAVIQLLATMVGDAVKKEGQPAVNGFIRRLFGRHDPGTPAPAALSPAALTPDQLAAVRKVALERARLIGLKEDRAALLADAIAGGISVAPST